MRKKKLRIGKLRGCCCEFDDEVVDDDERLTILLRVVDVGGNVELRESENVELHENAKFGDVDVGVGLRNSNFDVGVVENERWFGVEDGFDWAGSVEGVDDFDERVGDYLGTYWRIYWPNPKRNFEVRRWIIRPHRPILTKSI